MEKVTTKRMSLYTGRTHPDLAQEVAEHLGVATQTHDIEPALAANLTLVIQGLVVLLVSTDVLVVYLWKLRRRRLSSRKAVAA